MNMLQFLFGRAVRARRPRAEILSPPSRPSASRTDGNPARKRNATIHVLTFSLIAVAVLCGALGQEARADTIWSFTADMPSGWTALSAGSQNLDMGDYLLAESTASPDGMYSPAYNLAGWTSVTVTGRVATYGSGTAQPLVIDISTDGGSTWGQSVTSATPSSKTYINTGTMTVTLTLTANTVFRLRSGGTSGRDVRMQNFSCQGTPPAASAPTVTTLGESSVAASSAVLGGNVTADGGDTVTNRGVCYKTSATVTISDNKTQIGSGTGAFSNTVSSLSVNVHYYFRAYAQNSAGTSLGSESNFWTLANVPSAPTVNNPTSSSLDVAVNENSNPSSTEFAIKVTYGATTKYVQSDGTLGDSEAWATDSTWGTRTVTGLSSSTEYTFSVAARNGANVATAYSSTASGTTSASGCAERWTCLDNLGAPVYTYYLGDSLAYIFYYELNTDTFGWTSDYGLGTTTNGSGWTWRSATYDSNNGSNWKWKNNASEHQFTSVGNWYYAGRFVNGGCTYYADKTWQSTSAKALNATNYFAVSALNNPGSQTATAAGATNISLSWAKDAQSHDVMIVRSTDSSFTAPTQGTAYTAGSSTIGGDLVIYNGNGTSYNDTGRTQGTMYYYKFYSVNNDYYSAGVTANATTWTLPTVSTTSATPGTPADPTQANSTGNVTAEGGVAVTERGIVWNTTGAPTTANNKVAHASGGTGPFTVTLTSLTPGQKIYYRAYAINSVGTAYGSTLDFTADCFTNGPGILAASPVGYTNFTANWSAVGGASGYQLDVSTNATFVAGGGATTNLSEDFTSLNATTHPSGWTGSGASDLQYTGAGYYGNASPAYKFKTTGQWLLSPTFATGSTNLQFWALGNNGSGSTFAISGLVNSAWTLVDTVSIGTGGATYNVALDPDTTQFKISFTKDVNCALDDVLITGGGSTPSYVLGFSNLTVVGTSQSVTGLTSDVKYFYRVRAVNDYCTSTNSATTNVTTVAATANVVLGDNGTQVVAATVAAGTTAHILHQFQLGVTVANATLTNVSFTTAGSYAAADITKLQVWYSADDSLNTGTDTKLGSDITTGLGPGSHGITGLSQAINVGDTGYIFITADIAGSPTYGKTINVAAITTGDVGFTAATKSGSTTAGGAQTIVAAEPTVHATTLLFTAVQTNQMTVSWTSGNGERRIVVVRPALATSWTPTDFVAPAGVDANYDGATDKGSGNRICYDGTGNSFTLTGLNAGTTYAVTVFEYNGTGTYVNYFVTGTPLSGSQMTACPAAPTGLFANPTNQFDFTANWTAVAGATGYRIDVSSNDLSGSSLSTNLYESFASFTLAENTDISGSLDTYTLVPGWTGSKVYSAAAGGLAKIGAASTAGELITPSLNLSGNGGAATLTYDAYSYGSDSAAAIISVSINGGSSYAIVVTNTFSGSMTTYTVELTGCTATTKIKIESRIASSCRFYLDEFKVMQGGAFSYVPGYENLAVAGTSVSVTGLQDSVTYYWRVAATGAECTGSYSTVTNVTTLPGPPPKPTGLTASDGTETAHVALSWNNDSAKETGFVIYRHTSDVFASATAIYTNAADVTTYNDTSAAVGTLYYYWVVATNAIGVSPASDSDSGYRKLETVTGLSASECSNTNHVSLSWTDIDGETGYGIWRSTSDNSGTAAHVGTVAANVTSYNDTTAVPGTLYTYWVRATNSACGTLSDFQSAGVVGVRKLATVTVTASDGTDTSRVVVQWTDIAGETGYAVWRSETDDSGTAEWLANVAADGNVLSEDFEDAWAEAPSGWSREIVSGTTEWIRDSGGHSGYPAAAHGGTYNALFYSGSSRGSTNRLITPSMDLSGFSGANVDFWHAQAVWSTDQDILRVLYRTSSVASWVQLAEYTTDISSWTERNLSLPNLSADYYVAFEAVGDYGYGVVLDDVAVTGLVSSVTNYYDEEAVAGTQYYYWVMGTNSASGCYSDFGTGDGGWRRLVENPSSVELTRDGREMVRAAITANANSDTILVLHSTLAEVSGIPALNSSYTVGATLGNAKVIYKGAAPDFREHVVSANTTNHYRVFSVLSNAYYSSGVIPTGSPIETKPYQPNVGVETFSYTNVTLSADSFTNKAGGANWATGSNWVLEASGTSWQVFTNDAYDGRPMFFTAASNMATHSGNRAFIDLNGAGRWGNATRQLPTVSTGSVFVSALMAYRYESSSEGTDRWLTMALMNGTTEELEFGKVWGANRTFTIRRNGANAASSYGLNPYGDSTNNWYWVVLKYDFENDIAKAKAFYRGENIPSTEPSTWDVEWSSMSIAQVTALRLKAGSGTDWLGGGLFDEVRVSSVWPALLGEPDLIITPEEKNFGDTEVNRTDVQTFWVQNTGGDNVPLSVSSLTLGGTNPTNFFLSTNTLGTIEYGQSNSFTVTFLPNLAATSYSATLYLTNSSGVNPVTVALQGTGIPSQLTNAPAVDDYWVGETNQVTDAMVTSGVFSVVLKAYHPAGIATAKYSLLNSSSTVILTNQTFESWTSADGMNFVFSNATHAGYWPATPGNDYLVEAVLISSNGYGMTNTSCNLAGGVESTDLFISEYIEGSGNSKAIEIYNGTGASVVLSNYTLRIYANGGVTPSSSIALNGTLAAGAVHVVAHSSASAAILAKAHQPTGSLTFNGDDAVTLAKGGSNIDVVGIIGSQTQPGAERTLVRSSSVTDGTTTYTTGQWTKYPADTTTYLGAHTMEGGGGTPMRFQVIDDDTEPPVISNPLVNGTTAPAGTASNAPTIAIGDVPAGGFDLDWDIQDTGSGVFAASNHYTLARSNAVISSGAVPTGSDGDGQGSALAVGTTIAKSSLIWGDYVLSLAGADYDPEWDGDISSVSNVYYFVIAAPSIGLLPSSLDYGSVERDVTSNLTVAVTNSGNADLVVSGIGFSGTGSGYFSVASPAVPLTVTAGTASNVVVSFTPTAGGTFSVTMTLTNNTPNAAEATVSIAGECYDPETAPPSIYAYAATDAAGITNEATDHALAHGGLTLDFTLWHYMGVDPATASYDLLDPSGALVWTNGTFDTVTETTLNSKTCQVFTAAVPDILPAVTGVYTARVTATSSNAYSVTDQATYDPPAAGSAAPWPLDRFSREDSVNDAGNGWLPAGTGATNGNIAVKDHRLQFYGEGGTVGDGRLAVVRDMTGRYQTVLTNNSGTLTWAFNFFSGQNNMTGLGSGKYAGLFVLGSTSTNFVGGTGDGYAVRICSNQVALVKFTGGLNSDADATVIGTPAALSAGTPMGVRVDMDPATGEWTLYTTNWGGTGPEAFGNPLAADDLATSNVDATYLGATSLPYVGCYWNHGSGAPGSTYGAVFDDVYAPYVMPAAPLMNFTVIDEDWRGPEHSGFNVDNRAFTVASIASGLTVTGLVADANGVYAGTSNVWTLFSNSTQVASGSMTMTPNTDGAGTLATPAALSTTIPFNALNTTNYTFTFRLVSTDFDVDRPGDFLSITNTFTFTIVDTEAPTPTDVTATGDGMEMAVLTWNLNGAKGAVVLRSADSAAIAAATMLTMGTAYNQGDAGPNGTTVAYHGTNQTGAEIVVPMGSSNYFRVFGANGTIYSVDSVAPAVVPLLKYEDGEIVDQFAYTNNAPLMANGPATGQGWSGGWFGDSNAVLMIDDTNLLHGVTLYPDPYANKLQWVANSQVATNVEVTRKLATQRSGRTFIAFMMNYKVGSNDDVLTNKYVGLSLMSGAAADTEEIFFGKIHGHDKDAGIYVPGTGEYASDSPNYALEGKHFCDYMIVGEWDPSIKTIRMWAFYQGDTTPIPQEYTNAPPIATFSNSTFNIGTITGIRLAAGMTADDTNSLDHVYFDEVRVGGTWDEVLNFNYPKAFGFSAGVTINGTNYVSDGELSEAGKSYPISYTLYHRTGVTNAQFNIVTNVGSLDGLYTSPLGLVLDPNDTSASDRYRDFTNMVSTRLDTNLVTLGVYTSRVWMTAVSGKATNTLFMEGMAGATDLFFGEFGEGEGYDKYVEIYNGTGGSIDLSQYYLKVQMNPSDYEDYTQNTWSRTSYLATNTFWLDHGETIVIANGGGPSGQKADPALTNALATAGLDYLLSSNDVLNVSGNDVIGLFHVSSSDEWIDACGIAPNAGSGERYIMRRIEDAEVPLSYPLPINTNDWDYRAWATPDSDKDVGYTNFLATAGEYDRNVGLGGYITFTVYDDDTLPPAMGTNNVLMIGTGAPYTPLTASNGSVEVVLTAWNFNGDTPAESATTWSGSLIPNGTITCHPDYTPGPVDDTDSGTSENDMFGVYDQPNDGVAELASIGTYFTQADTAWIQYEIELTSADDMVLSWAEAGGSFGFNTAQLSWSSDGVSFSTNAAWPSWDPTDGSTYVTRYAEFDGVVTPGLSKVYIRINLGPGYGGSSGYYRMDNVQLTGYPQEFQVTDGQIAASGNKLQFQANLYDTNSGLDKAQAVMELQGATGTRVPGNDTGDGTTETDTMWWELSLTGDDITEYVNASLTGNGLSFDVDVPDLDADRPGDPSWLDGRIGQVRVIDDDTGRPRLSLTSMKPLSSILAQWYQMTDTNSLLPTKSDASVDAGPLKTKSGTDAPKSPYFSREPTNGYHYIEAWAWQGQQKCWVIEVTPEADMAVTNLTFTAYMHRTNGVSHYRIDHYVDGVLENNILGDTYWVDPPGMLDPTVWYTRSHGWATNEVVLEAGKVNQIRLYGLGSSNIGARWRLSELTLWQAAMSDDGVLEVTDAEFTSGSFKLTGNAWDTGSGIASPTHATPAKRPMFSLNAPDGGVLVSNQLFAFTGEVLNGGATTKEAGAFEGSLPTPVYTNVMLGSYTGEAHVWDYDDDRTDDDLRLRGDLAMYVVDNDIGVPTAVGTLRVNGNEVPGTAPDRFNVAWTNQPGFIVSFDSVAVDQDPGDTYSAKQRALTGIGEYRVGTNASINSLTASNRATLGKPYPVATTNGALANYGFEMGATTAEAWTFAGDAAIQWLRLSSALVKEGTNSLKLSNGGSAHQLIEFRNTEAIAPEVGVSGWYRSDTTEGSTFRIEAFATNDLTNAVASRDLSLPATGTNWTFFALDPAVAVGDGTVEVLRISLIDGGGNTTFWDDIRLSVDIGANTPSMRFTAGAENQGLNPQYLFAVDSDNNRAGDRLAGAAAPFYIAYDVTPPTKVGDGVSLAASTETVDDPTTQFDLQWNSTDVGPDDPDHTNHPTQTAGAIDVLSPWRSYKVYYATFDPTEVPSSDGGPGTADAYVYTNFILTNAYRTWSNVAWNSTIDDPSATGTNYLALTNRTQTKIRLYDLDFDQDYAVVIVGLDKAGNEGPAGIYSWATNNTIKFALTRGWTLPKDEAETYFPNSPMLARTDVDRAAGFAWLAAGNTNPLGTGISNRYLNVSKDYDLIYMDAPSFKESISNEWKLLGTVRTNWFVDDGGFGKPRGTIRFYRASYKDRWRKTREIIVSNETVTVAQRPLASEEVYALHNIILSPGPNFVAFHGIPYTNTFYGVFGGTETFPGGTTENPASGATVVEFYSAGTNAVTVSQYWLSSNGVWNALGGSDVTHVHQNEDFFTRGFSINLPPATSTVWTTYGVTNALDYNRLDESNRPAVVPAMIWSAIAQVPTNAAGFSQTIQCGNRRANPPALVYNVVALRLPVAAHPSQMKLLECGFVKGIKGQSDEIYTMNTATKDVMAGSTIYCDTNGVWRFVGNNGLVGWGYFKPNDVIVIVSKNGGLGNSWTWTYTPTDFYTLPTRWMGWTDVPLASEPTVNANNMVFTNVSATQIGVGWTSGDGARRIVVVKQGTTTTWTPTDSVGPSGVNSDFPQATDQGGGNRICYDGTGNSFLLRGLNPGTYYSFAVYEYNGTGTGANYLTGGSVLVGSRATN